MKKVYKFREILSLYRIGNYCTIRWKCLWKLNRCENNSLWNNFYSILSDKPVQDYIHIIQLHQVIHKNAITSKLHYLLLVHLFTYLLNYRGLPLFSKQIILELFYYSHGGKNNSYYLAHRPVFIYGYITIIMPFSDNFTDGDIKDHIKRNDFLDDSKITTSKRVKSLRQLTRIEKELVKLVYKEAALKCLSLEDTQKYITLKTKIFIEENCLGLLKKTEEQENREWFYRTAKDQEWFILNFKKAMDKIELYERELWSMAEDSNTKEKTKLKVFQELHKLTITSTLLLRDLHL
jgi:hypothetical protein